MTIVTLKDYAQIKTSSGNPETSRRPSLAFSNEDDTMFMAYTGEHAWVQGLTYRRVWWIQSPSIGSPNSWTKNQQIKTGGNQELLADTEVAMVIYQGVPGIISSLAPRVFANWFDGNQWTSEQM